jgi:hypothetical protein
LVLSSQGLQRKAFAKGRRYGFLAGNDETSPSERKQISNRKAAGLAKTDHSAAGTDSSDGSDFRKGYRGRLGKGRNRLNTGAAAP